MFVCMSASSWGLNRGQSTNLDSNHHCGAELHGARAIKESGLGRGGDELRLSSGRESESSDPEQWREDQLRV